MPNEPTKRRGRPPKAEEVKPDVILQAALKCFAMHGFEGASLRRIATASNVDVALIAHRHGAKLELWKAVVDDIASKFVLKLSRSRSPAELAGASSMDRLQLAIDQMIDFSAQSPEMAMFVIKEIAQRDERFQYVYERLIRPAQQVLLPTVECAIAEGYLKDVDPELFFYNVSGAVALTVSMRSLLGEFDGDALSSEHFLRGMKALWRSLLAQ
ncbi:MULTISPECIES: TetR/AcrR family transcriptional regulator [unclassified Pseudomonas]|uniref:TetR/AcrR family transcriptional regulator n=1 Tax=unclassified Pseudomonas TaxID=196821 RepID=UPI0025EDA666|nr:MULTISPECIES: helix-turn-helix domain-containing protein [unclassified Pseudomonas]